MGNLHSSFNDRRKSNVSNKNKSSSSIPCCSSSPPPLSAQPQQQSSSLPAAGFVRRTTLRLQKKLSISASTTTPTTNPSLVQQQQKQQQRHSLNPLLRLNEPQQEQFIQNTFSPVIKDDTNIVRLGRRYQNINPKYVLPNDEIEQDRLTNLHFILKHCFNGNYSAPVQDLLQQSASTTPSWINNISTTALSHGSATNTTSTVSTGTSSVGLSTTNDGVCCGNLNSGSKIQPRVLDIACGTGIWILEMASEFPHAQFHGIDLSAMYPADIKPPNTHFCQGDVLNGLPYTDGCFDYVHMSLIYNCFSIEDRKKLLYEIRRVLKPGGYIEFRDVDPIIRNPGPTTSEYIKPFPHMMHERLDVDVNWAAHMCENAQNYGGMTDIHHQIVSISFVSSSKLSASFNTSVLAEWESYRSFSLQAYDFADEDYDSIIRSVMDECKKKRSYLNYVMCWGRKPIIDVPTSNSSICHMDYGTPPPPPLGQRHSVGCNTTYRSVSTSPHEYHDVSSFIKSVSSPRPTHSSNSTLSRPSPKSGTYSSTTHSGKNSPGSLRAREDARRNKEKTSDIYQFVHGYVE
ncbi:hypothetical protein BDA99DRAFT_509659 [Phascolomyces articulosus]|uniref:Methyltransferase domain-containing protein n=1 Tax=Phascolomyces articulosus TaxID=60185 RepID=A0AAD5K069_9FUNG|nr:hypothetical protein BDA99DRAFT_509659 [Phascolomyces articulosus]